MFDSGVLPRQVARAGRFGTKGLAITFVSDETDAKTLNDVQDRFEVNVAELPDEIDISSYSKSESLALGPAPCRRGPGCLRDSWSLVMLPVVFTCSAVVSLSPVEQSR